MSTGKVKEIIKEDGVDMNLYDGIKKNTKRTRVQEQSGVFRTDRLARSHRVSHSAKECQRTLFVAAKYRP